MPEFDPELLAAWTDGRWEGGVGIPVDGFGIDTRCLPAGAMFLALRGPARDGHDYLGAAWEAGAAAALVSRRVPGVRLPQLVVADVLIAFQRIAREHRRRFSGPVIGITGTAGKTSTKEMIARLLGPQAAATAGNLNNFLGVPLTLTQLESHRHKFAVVEAGISAPGEMRVLAEMIEPDVAVVTLVGPAHLEELGSVEGVAREKAVLASAARPGGVAVFPEACRAFAPFRELATPALDLEASSQPAAGGRRIMLRERDGAAEEYFLPSPSAGMAQNAALALRVGRHLGVPAAILRERLATWAPAPLRGEIRRDQGRLLYLDYYNANPASMLDALAAFDQLAGRARPRLFLLGAMEELGGEAERRHRELGAALPLREGDRVLFVGDWAEAVRGGAGSAGGQIEALGSAAEAAGAVAEFSGAVFVKGSRKHRLEQALPAPAGAAC